MQDDEQNENNINGKIISHIHDISLSCYIITNTIITIYFNLLTQS